MCLTACNTRTVIFHEICISYYNKLSFYLSNGGLFETIALTEAWKISVKVVWSSQHFSYNNYCQIVWFVYQFFTGAFSHNNCISLYTFSYEKLYSAHAEVSRPVVKPF